MEFKRNTASVTSLKSMTLEGLLHRLHHSVLVQAKSSQLTSGRSFRYDHSQKLTQTAAGPSIVNMIWEIVTTAGIQFDPTLDHFYELIRYFLILKEFSLVWFNHWFFDVFSAVYLRLRFKVKQSSADALASLSRRSNQDLDLFYELIQFFLILK